MKKIILLLAVIYLSTNLNTACSQLKWQVHEENKNTAMDLFNRLIEEITHEDPIIIAHNKIENYTVSATISAVFYNKRLIKNLSLETMHQLRQFFEIIAQQKHVILSEVCHHKKQDPKISQRLLVPRWTTPELDKCAAIIKDRLQIIIDRTNNNIMFTTYQKFLANGQYVTPKYFFKDRFEFFSETEKNILNNLFNSFAENTASLRNDPYGWNWRP